jgi:hypothetical protein
MPTLSTYHLTPHLPLNGKATELTTEFFREMVNQLVRDNWDKFMEAKADPSLFFNHDLETGKTRVGYPLVIYHFVNDIFYVTGINEGAKAVELLAALYTKPLGAPGLLFPGFIKTEYADCEIENLSDQQYDYRLANWIPYHYKDYGGYKNLPFAEKVMALNQRLQTHLVADMAKYLELDFGNLRTEITDFISPQPKPFFYEGHKYYAYNIEFTANINFPNFLTLGNNKALGFGRIEKR